MSKKKETTAISPKLRRLEGLRRRAKVKKLLLKGLDIPEIAQIMGLPYRTIKKIHDKICDEMETKDEKSTELLRQKRLEQADLLTHTALDEFERSRQDEVIVTTTKKRVMCSACRGTRELRGEPCSVCEEDGRVEVVEKNKRVRGKVGDSSLLKEAREAVKMGAQIEGLDPAKKVDHNVSGAIGHVHYPGISDDNKYKDASPESLLELMSIQAKIEDEAKQKKKEGDYEVLEAEIVDPAGDGDEDTSGG